MVNDWESAFEACPPYGEGKGAYGPEDTALLTEMERTLEGQQLNQAKELLAHELTELVQAKKARH